MKRITALLGLMAFSVLGLQAQDVELTIKHQRLNGNELTFDVYLRATSGTVYLGNADLVLDYDEAAFSSPVFSFVHADSIELLNSNAATVSGYSTYISPVIGTGSNANRLLINILQPSFIDQTEFNSNIPAIGTTERRLGTFKLTNMTSPASFPEFVWKTAGSGTKTKVFRLNNSTPWKSFNQSISDLDPTLVAEPGTQITNLVASAASEDAVDLSWTAGSGARTIVLAKASSAVSTDLPGDGIEYFADAVFASGSQLFSSGVYVVYNGSGTSVQVTGLDPGTVYHFAAITYDGADGQTENYNTTAPATASSTTFLAPPTTIVSGLALTPQSNGDLQISWSANGDGSNRIVVVREYATARVAPANGTDYSTVSLDLGSPGDVTGSGNYVVYNGNDAAPYSITVTGLSPATRYAVEVYEYNGTGGVTENYLDPGAQADDYTFDTEPTGAVTSLAVSAVSHNTIDLSWALGTGADRTIIVAKAGASAASNTPSDGTDYSANAAFGSGDDLGSSEFVVYDGGGTSVQITGLSSASQYTFIAYSLKGTGNGTENYYLTGAPTVSDYTWATEPTGTVAGLSITPQSDGTADVAWTSLNAGAGANRVVVIRETVTAAVAPTDGTAYTTGVSLDFSSSTATTGTGNVVVYNGAAASNSLNISGLDPATQYTVEVYEYNGSGNGTENYYATPASATDYTFDTQPTALAALNVTAVTENSLTLGWTNTGEKVLIIASTSPIATNPTDGTAYTGNAAYSTGDAIGAGYVVYNGTGTSVTVTGLNAATLYYLAAYAYNEDALATNNTENYAAATTADDYTHATTPTAEVTAFTATVSGSSGIDLSWTKGTGASNTLIIARAGNTASAYSPVDGTAFTANADFTVGQDVGTGEIVVYNGTGTSVSVSGLSAATEYTFIAIAVNGSGNGTENYYTTNAPTASEYTYASEPTGTVAGLTITPNSDGTADVAWTSLNVGAGANRIVVIRPTAAAADAPDDGTVYNTGLTLNIGTTGTTTGTNNFVVYNGSASSNSLNVSGLTPATQYTVDVYEYNGTGNGTENYYGTPASATDYTFDTEPAAVTGLAVTDTSDTSIELSWTGAADNYLVVISTSAIAGSPADGTAYTANGTYNNGQDVLNAGEYVVYNSSGTTATINGLAAGTQYHFAVFAYNVGAVTGETENYTSGTTGSVYTFSGEPTVAASNMIFSSISTTGMTVSWTNGDGARRIVVAKAGSAPANGPSDGQAYTANAAYGSGADLGGGEYVVYDGTGSSVAVTGLTMNETYYYVVYEYNGSGNGQENYLTGSSLSGSENTYIGVQVKAFLEGPFNGVDMNTDIASYVPANQPYSIAPWSYAGGESHSGLPANVVDWVLVELRTGASAGTATTVPANGIKAAFILSDGRIVDTDGSSNVVFDITQEGDFYVVVRHRTHLAAISSGILSYDGTDERFEYDFTDAIGKTYNSAAAELSGPVYGLFSGRADLTGYGLIDGADRTDVWDARNSSGGYFQADVNLDGDVDAGDRNVTWNNRDEAAETVTAVQ